MNRLLYFAILAAAACGDAHELPDAVLPDASAPVDTAPPDMAPEPACEDIVGGTHKLFLVFDGVTLQPGTTDPVTNTWGLVNSSATVPAWRANDPARQAGIDEVVCDTRRMLRPFDIDVVTDRPAAAPYMMIVIGGLAADVHAPVGYRGLAETDCGRQKDSELGWISEREQGAPDGDVVTPRAVAQRVAGIVGVAAGVDPTTAAGDCMCGWGNLCVLPATALCTFGAAATPEPRLCSTSATQNEPALMIEEYGARP